MTEDQEVNFDNMTKEELDTYINNARNGNDNNQSVDNSEKESENTVSQPEQNDKANESSDNNQEVKESNEKKDDFVFDSEKYKDFNFSEAQLKIIQDRDKQIYHSQKLIQRHSVEVHEARKKEIEIRTKESELQNQLKLLTDKEEELKNSFHLNPDDYQKVVVEKALKQMELEKVSSNRIVDENRNTILRAVPEFDSLQNEMIEVAKQDLELLGKQHLIPQIELEIKRGDFVYADPIQAINVATRAKLIRQNREYEQKIKELSTAPDQVGKKISAVANQRPIAPTQSYSKSIEKDPDEMSYDELVAFLKANKK